MVRKEVLETAQKVLLVAMGFIVLTIGYLSWRALDPQDDTTALELPSPVPTHTPVPTSEPPPKVGIVAGHYESDSGAVCPDGLQEVEINLAIAEKVVALLRRKGYQVELLGELDEALFGYQADAFVSLHSDSCDIPGASGFKVARVTNSAVLATRIASRSICVSTMPSARLTLTPLARLSKWASCWMTGVSCSTSRTKWREG